MRRRLLGAAAVTGSVEAARAATAAGDEDRRADIVSQLRGRGWPTGADGAAARDDAGHTERMSRLAVGVRALGHRRWFAVLGRTLMPLDRAIGRLTGGRFVALGLHGLPSMLLTTVGRRSGLARTAPLLYAADGDGYVVIGSNWGQPHQPAWALNLLAEPRATVTLHGRRVPVRAVLATGAERERLLRLLTAVWPAYETYLRRAAGRDVMVFRLVPTG